MAKRIQKEREQFGGLALQLTAADRLALIEAKRKAEELGVSIWKIFEAGLSVLPANPKTVAQLKDDFIAFKESALAQGGIRKNSKWAMVGNAKRFAEAFGPRIGMSITKDEIREYLAGRRVKGVMSRPSKSYLATFINWCSNKNQMAGGLMKGLAGRRAVEELPVIWTHGQVLEAVRLVPAELLHVFALQWFAGIRPHTSYRLRYEDVHHAEKTIEIPPGSGKSSRKEFVEHIPETIWSWIPAGLEGFIAPKNAAVKMMRARKAWGNGTRANRAPHDVARHTFATHMLALTKDLTLTSQALTHTTIQMTKRHYLNRVPHEAGVAYFAMTPEVVFGPEWKTCVPQTPTRPEE